MTPPRWVEYKPSGELALIVRDWGSGLLIRYVTRGRDHYHTVDADSVVRRPELDGVHVEPAWLLRARESRRPPLILRELLLGLDTHVPPGPCELTPDPMFETDADGRPLEVLDATDRHSH